jgi:voltage-gated potassium channel Kch
MPDLMTVLVCPLVVAVFALLIEYWIIQPIVGRHRSKHRNSYQHDQRSRSPRSTNDVLLLTGTVAFLFVILAVLGGFRANPIRFLGFNVGTIDLTKNTVLSDANLSFAALLYTSAALSIVVFSVGSLPRWSRVFGVAFLPSGLLFLWIYAFLRDERSWYLFGVFVANTWLTGVICVLDKTGSRDVLEWFTVSALACSATSFLFPANALNLIFVTGCPPLCGWILAAVILTIEIWIIKFIADARL